MGTSLATQSPNAQLTECTAVPRSRTPFRTARGAARLMRRRSKRLARKYSIGSLFAVLVCLCSYHLLIGRGGSGEAARRLADPEDPISLDARRSGALILHACGLLYMFVAIAIVCDECFVPALEVITDVLSLTPDVAGATFMAAGGSAPEFFTSLIAALLVESDIGTGTIIGSAVFNVLFVIGACALIAPTQLQLTWFPLARDCSFYAVDLISVTCVFLDEEVRWYEAMFLFCLYIAYAIFMKHSEDIGKRYGFRTKGGTETEKDVLGDEEARWARPTSPGNCAATVSAATGQAPSHAVHHKVIAVSTDVSLDEEEAVVEAAGTGEGGNVRTLPRSGTSNSRIHRSDVEKQGFRHKSLRVANHVSPIRHSQTRDMQQVAAHHENDDSTGGSGSTCITMDPPVPAPVPGAPPAPGTARKPCVPSDRELLTDVVPGHDGHSRHDAPNWSLEKCHPEEDEISSDAVTEDEDVDEPLSIWPPENGSLKDMVSWALTLPILVALVSTVPDVRREGYRRWYVATFAISIGWIAAFTWVMVWLATVIAETCDMEEHIMGLTILAAGTSVPDLLTSMIVARQGHGDMAISSSIGSNIFDVTVGLPVPWMLYIMVKGKPVQIINEGLEISVMLLLLMLGITVGIILAHGWVMTKWMGASMLCMYAAFQIISVSLTFFPKGSLKLIRA